MNEEFTGNIKLGNENYKLFYETIKRNLDILLSLIGIIFSLPFIIIFSIAIKIESKGPFLYKQVRVGLNGNNFTIYKLRTMYISAEKEGVKLAKNNDPRITKIGKLLRRTKLDELPQLINILKGEMSIVGPRPERPYFLNIYTKGIPRFKNRLIVKPGLTGYAQINGSYDIKPKDKLNMDLFYIENRSVLLDLKIIFKTTSVIINGKGFR